MSYTITKPYTLYKLEQVQKEIGVNDLLDWSRLIAGYDLNPKMTTYQGFTGMEEAEKNRIVQELRARLATMPEIKPSLPASKTPYGCKRSCPRTFALYTMEDVHIAAQLDGMNNAGKLARIIEGWNPRPEIIERNGHKGFTEQEKARLVAELEALKDQFEAKERQAYLEKMAFQESHVLPSSLW